MWWGGFLVLKESDSCAPLKVCTRMLCFTLWVLVLMISNSDSKWISYWNLETTLLTPKGHVTASETERQQTSSSSRFFSHIMLLVIERKCFKTLISNMGWRCLIDGSDLVNFCTKCWSQINFCDKTNDLRDFF